MSKLEALITDLDGSLLNSHQQIGERDIITLQTLRDKGVKVFIATGRHQGICRIYANQLNLGTPAVTSNGGLLYDFEQEKVLSAHYIEPEVLSELVRFTKEQGLAYYLSTATATLLDGSNPDSPNFQFDMALCSIAGPGELVLMEQDYDPLSESVVKLVILDCAPEQVAALEQSPLGRSGLIQPTCSGYHYLDINSKGVSKGSALRELSERYGFSLENTLAMGDNMNDLEMLQAAGYPVVPQSAREDLHPHARFVTASHDDNPITHAIEALFPELLK